MYKHYDNIVKDRNILLTLLEERLFITLREPCQNVPRAFPVIISRYKYLDLFYPIQAVNNGVY